MALQSEQPAEDPSDRGRRTLQLLNWEDAATAVSVLSGLLVLESSRQSRLLLEAGARGEESRPHGVLRPARTALQSMALAIIAAAVLAWTSVQRLEERRTEAREGGTDGGPVDLTANLAIAAGCAVSVAAAACKALGVGKKYGEEASVVIF